VGRLLALDVGEKRVGVALSDETATLARPWLTLKRASKKEDFARLATLCREQQIEKIVVGLPKTLRNEEGPQARRVRRYAAELQAAFGLPVDFWDERFSSMDAQERLAAASRKVRAKGDIDAAAAAIILQEYLDELNHGQLTMTNDQQPTTSD
jgi:putative holliday junction resolvase